MAVVLCAHAHIRAGAYPVSSRRNPTCPASSDSSETLKSLNTPRPDQGMVYLDRVVELLPRRHREESLLLLGLSRWLSGKPLSLPPNASTNARSALARIERVRKAEVSPPGRPSSHYLSTTKADVVTILRSLCQQPSQESHAATSESGRNYSARSAKRKRLSDAGASSRKRS